MIETKSNFSHKAYHQTLPTTWWLRNRRSFMFMIRELTSVFVAIFVLVYLYKIFLLTKSQEAYNLFQESLRSSPFIASYLVIFLFALYHSITWLGLVPKIQIVRLGRLTIPPTFVALGAYFGWALVSAVIGYLFWTL